MKEKHLKNLNPFKTIAAYGIGAGLILLVFGFFVNGFSTSYILTGLGIGLTTSSVVIFLGGTFLSLMAEYAVDSKGKQKDVSFSRGFYK